MSAQPTILIVDDERDIVETLDFALRRRGFTVRVAYDGQEALEMAKLDPPDLMLLDVMLPGCNGYEVSRRLKDWMVQDPEHPHFPILLLTARRVNSIEREEFISTWSRADAVVYKPFILETLLRRIEELLPQEAQSALPQPVG
jgi:two-component system alkaline phosphatase synthesis response regulator PhoP